jgi:hypothetical protein
MPPTKTASGLAMAMSLGAALGAIVTVVACSESPDPGLGPTYSDAGGNEPTTDGEVPDGTPDGGEGDGEAGPPRVCSQESFCHTIVPGGQTLRAGWSDENGVAWAISTEGAILRWDGTTWFVSASGLGELVSIWGSGPTDIWVGGTGGLYHGHGASSASVAFTPVSALPGEPTPITSVWGIGPDDVWAVGPSTTPDYHGRVLHYTGVANGWSLDAASNQPIQYARVWGSVTSGVWLAGVHKNSKDLPELAVRRRPVGASDFAEVTIPGDPEYLPDNLYARLNTVWGVSGSSDDTVWIVGEQAFGRPGYVRGTTSNGGQTYTWSFTSLGDRSLFLPNAVWGISANDAWIGGDFGRLRHWDGTTWKQAFITITKYPVVDPFYGIWGRGANDLWVVGAGIAMHRDLTNAP